MTKFLSRSEGRRERWLRSPTLTGRHRGRALLGAASLALATGAAVVPSATAGAPPPARAFSTMAYDTVAQKIVLFGGSPGGFALGTETVDDTWAWNGTTWKESGPATRPPARKGATMAYDKSARTTVLFGGDAGCCTRLGDMWTRASTTKNWAQEPSTSLSPPVRSDAMMAYDASTRTTVLFGGLGPATNTLGDSTVKLGDTWTWDGATRAWTQQAPPVSPPARARGTMAYDAATGTVVLFGGEPTGIGGLLSDTWIWNGTAGTWAQQAPAVSPPPRTWAAMAYHRASSAVVLFGGAGGAPGTSLDDTWVWSGATGAWAQRAPATSPSPRVGSAMAEHVPTGVLVLFGGSAGSPNQETWTWNGTNWKQRLA